MARAREASMRRIRAWACGECRMRACSGGVGSVTSSTNVPRPVASLTLSTRRSERPMVVSSGVVSDTAARIPCGVRAGKSSRPCPQAPGACVTLAPAPGPLPQPEVAMRVPLAILAGSLVASTAAAQVPAGPERVVNTYTSDGQLFPAVAHLPDGGFVVVWHGAGEAGPYSLDGVFGQ